MRISDWSSDVCSSDLPPPSPPARGLVAAVVGGARLGGRQGHHLRQARIGGGGVGDRHGLDEVGLELRLHRGLDLLDLADDLLDLVARALVQQGDASAGAGGVAGRVDVLQRAVRSEEHTSELKSLMRISYAVFCSKKK